MAPQEKPSLSPDQIDDHLNGIDYPIRKEELKQQAQNENAPYYVVEVIEQMPDRKYNAPDEVADGIGDAQ